MTGHLVYRMQPVNKRVGCRPQRGFLVTLGQPLSQWRRVKRGIFVSGDDILVRQIIRAMKLS